MPLLPLHDDQFAPDILVHDSVGGVLNIPLTRFRCLVEVVGRYALHEAIIDTGAPLTIFPQKVWSQFRAGIDFAFLPFATPAPQAGVVGWRFTYHMAQFLVPLALRDTRLTVRVPRPDVIAQFAIGDPPGWRSAPPILVGTWGGLLEGGSVRIGRDARTNRATGELVYP